MLTVDTVLGTDDFARANELPISTPYLSWISVKPDLNSGSVVIGSGDFDGYVTRPEAIGPGCFFQVEFDGPYSDDPASYVVVGARLTAHSGSADGYTAWLEHSAAGLQVHLRKGSGFTTIATSAVQDYADVEGLQVKCAGSTITASVKLAGVWEEATAAIDEDFPGAGYVGFGLSTFFGSPPGIASVTWGNSDPLQTPVAERLYQRLEPIAYDDPNQDYALRDLCVALMAPLEITEFSRATDSGLVSWESLWDPDTCPALLLDWLAVANGVELPPSALTAAEKRYRIKQAAGRYRGTPRALAEEVQLELDPTSSQTVYMTFQSPDRWSYIVGTINSETPDPDAVEAAIMRQNPAFTLWQRVSTDDWSYFVLAPSLVATRVGDEYTLGAPTYPDYASLVAAFSDYQHLEDNDPDI